MASLLPNRTSEQCKTHHQKMIKKNKTFEGIIDYFVDKAKKKGIALPEKLRNEHEGICKLEEPFADEIKQ